MLWANLKSAAVHWNYITLACSHTSILRLSEDKNCRTLCFWLLIWPNLDACCAWLVQRLPEQLSLKNNSHWPVPLSAAGSSHTVHRRLPSLSIKLLQQQTVLTGNFRLFGSMHTESSWSSPDLVLNQSWLSPVVFLSGSCRYVLYLF